MQRVPWAFREEVLRYLLGSGEGGGQNISLFNCVTGNKFDRTKTDSI